jgi:hypothetical protein
VNVRGVFLYRLGEHGIDETDDGCVVFALEQVGLLGQVLGQMRQVGGLLDARSGFHCVITRFIGKP